MTGAGPTPQSVNRAAWDVRTPVHVSSAFYDVEGFRRGASSLKPVELALVGPVDGLRLLHLQCHFGLDTLSWRRLGATVTGLDLSPAAIAAARELARETGAEAQFVCADVESAGGLEGPFDIVVASYGVVCWLEHLDRWAHTIRLNLRSGGRFVLVDFHPLVEVIHPGKVSGAGRYFSGSPPQERWTTGTYADPTSSIAYAEYRWQHTLADVVAALLGAGLELVRMEEYPFCAYPIVEGLTAGEDGLWYAPEPGRIPYMFAIVVRAP